MFLLQGAKYANIYQMQAILKKRDILVNDIVLLEFDTLGDNVNFEPGQFFNLTLINPPHTDSRGNSRYFGFCNLPGTTKIQMIFKPGISAFKKSLLEIPLETQTQIDKINGLIDLSFDINQPVIFICDKIGIAPILSILKSVKEKNLQYKITLIYSDSGNKDLFYLNELKDFSNINPLFKLIFLDFLNSEEINKHILNLSDNLYFIKGEPKFSTSVFKTLKEMNINPSKIKMEIFTGY